MHRLLLDIPTSIETERLLLRCYRAGDGQWYYAMSRRNRPHLARYESGNVVMSVESEEDAETVVRDLAAAWVSREAFFLGAFSRESGEFVAQVYIGVVSWDLPEFEIGFFADVDHQGRGYVTEAVRASVGFIFEHLKGHRVRLECDDTNVRSCRVAERCGFTREGHVRENRKWPDGTFTGTVHYGLLSRELAAGA